MSDDADIERARLAIELERLELEKCRSAQEGRLTNRHFGAIVTALVSLAAVAVSWSQIQVAEIQKSRELELSEAEAERQWRIKAAEFVAENRSAIFSEDDQERQALEHVIKVAFPSEIAAGLLVRVERVSGSAILRRFVRPDGTVWNEENAGVLRQWMRSNNIDASITYFLHAAETENERLRAVVDLGLRERQTTITDIPDSKIAAVEEAFRVEGASAIGKELQSNGLWTITATFRNE